jgi:hypothetical protein
MVPADEAMITFFSSAVIGRERSRTLVEMSAVAMLLAPVGPGTAAGRFSSAEGLRLVGAQCVQAALLENC